jgi:mono/diheme cytochrome c family protein
MTKNIGSKRSLPLGHIGRCTAVGISALFLASSGFPAAGQDAADLAEGMRLFQQKGDCQACHGWAGDGRKMDSQMPDFDKFAYSDGRCFGLKQADLRTRGLQMTDPPATLTPNEIGLLADFIVAKIVGKGSMNRTQCIEFWGKPAEACNEFSK